MRKLNPFSHRKVKRYLKRTEQIVLPITLTRITFHPDSKEDLIKYLVMPDPNMFGKRLGKFFGLPRDWHEWYRSKNDGK